jgi:hypothetical protein
MGTLATGQRRGVVMGGSFDLKGRMIACAGTAILQELDKVFAHKNSDPYRNAKKNNTFGAIKDVQDNYKDLIIAYVVAGVDVGPDEWPAWCAYLKLLGTSPTGSSQNIYKIAQTRYNALNGDVEVTTKTHGGGGPVQTQPGEINSPCPL